MSGGLRYMWKGAGLGCGKCTRLLGFAVLSLAMLETAAGPAEGQLQDKKEKDKLTAPAVRDNKDQEKQKTELQPKPAPARGVRLPAAPNQGIIAPPPVAVPGMALPAVRIMPAQAGFIQGRVLAVPAPAAGQAVQFVDVQRANVAMFEKQIAPQMRQLYRSELHFVRAACNLSKAEYDQLSRECEPALKAATSELATVWNGPAAIRSAANNSPRAALSKEMAKSVRKVLPPEKAALYQKEVALREEARKKTIVNGLVARLDATLMLNADQRTKIEQVLNKHWSTLAHEPRMLMQGNRFFPRIPDEEVVEILTAAQRDEWNRLPKGNINYGLNLGFIQGFEEVEEIDEVGIVAPIPPPPPPAKDVRQPKPRPKS
jgi:hypothetical protein